MMMSITRGKKKPTIESGTTEGEIHAYREHRINKVTVAMDHGSEQFTVCHFDGLIAEAGGIAERTVQTQPFESLKVGAFCRLPCSVQGLADGSAFKVANEMCRKETSEQLARGLEGLESPFKK
jgi:hypothetical protein